MKTALLFATIGLAALIAPDAIPDPDTAEELDILQLVQIELEEDGSLPQWVKDLDGKEVVITGFMDPADHSLEPISTFRLKSDSCGCTGSEMATHYVEVTLDEETEYRDGQPVVVTGTFTIEDGVFRIDPATIE